MDQHELKEQCLALPGAREEFPFGDEVSVFKVGGKMFAACHLDGEPLQLSLKSTLSSRSSCAPPIRRSCLVTT